MNDSKQTVPLFRDGEEFFPRLFQAIKNAKREVIIETFELGEDRVGYDLLQAIKLAIRGGAAVYLTIDDWGSRRNSDEFRQQFIDAGVHLQLFEPLDSSILGKYRAYGRLHRKIAVIDSQIGFIGGINLRHCYMLEHDEGKRDVAVEIVGPRVADLRDLCLSHLPEDESGDKREQPNNDENVDEVINSPAEMRFVFRNNRENNSMIEDAWADLIDAAKSTITLAVAYFFPGERLCKKLIEAQKRGVNVCIIVQAEADEIMVHEAAQSLYNEFLANDIHIVEYKKRPLHAKVITVDEQFSIIGSSNLDPWSLHLNLEASVVIEDKNFAQSLRGFMQELIDESETITTENDWLERAKTFSNRGFKKLGFNLAAQALSAINPRDPVIQSLHKDRQTIKFKMKGEHSRTRNPLKWIRKIKKKY